MIYVRFVVRFVLLGLAVYLIAEIYLTGLEDDVIAVYKTIIAISCAVAWALFWILGEMRGAHDE